MYNLIDNSGNYIDIFGILWQLKRDGLSIGIINRIITTASSTSSKWKSRFLGESTAGNNRVFKSAKIAVALKYLNNFWESLEMSLINCKIYLELNWNKNCVMSHNNDETTFKITNTKFYVSIVTLSTKDNVNLTKQLNEGFKRPVYCNEYKTKIE